MKNEKVCKHKIAFLGGDMRTASVAHTLSRKGMNIFVWGVENIASEGNICVCQSPWLAISNAEAAILPLPASRDGMHLNCSAPQGSECEAAPLLSDIAEAMGENCILIGGRLPQSLIECAALHGKRCFDFFASEAFQIKNAYTTAEAALNIAMNSLNKNIRESRFAITGYGRIARQLAALLRAMGAEVCVAARRESDLAYAELLGCKTVSIAERSTLVLLCEGYDIIFNTVPQWLFDEELLSLLDENTLIVDLASSPGGVDIASAKRLKRRVLWATSLPGKYAPESAGALIASCVYDIIEREVPKC